MCSLIMYHDVGCPDNDTTWKDFGKSCYNLSNADATWYQAENECKKMNATLLKIDDQSEQENITSLINCQVRNLTLADF